MNDQAQTPPPQGLTKTSGLLDRIPGWAWTAAGLAVTAAAARGSLLRRVALGLVGTAITAAGARRAAGEARADPEPGKSPGPPAALGSMAIATLRQKRKTRRGEGRAG